MVATVDKTRLRRNNQKRKISCAVAHVKFSDITGQGTADINQLFKLPANCLIVDAGVMIDTVANGSITVGLGFDGGTELLAAADIHTATGYKQTTEAIASLTLVEATPNTLSAGTVTKSPRILTGTGKTVTAVFSAVPTAGEWRFIVEYIEYTLADGELTNYVA